MYLDTVIIVLSLTQMVLVDHGSDMTILEEVAMSLALQVHWGTASPGALVSASSEKLLEVIVGSGLFSACSCPL